MEDSSGHCSPSNITTTEHRKYIHLTDLDSSIDGKAPLSNPLTAHAITSRIDHSLYRQYKTPRIRKHDNLNSNNCISHGIPTEESPQGVSDVCKQHSSSISVSSSLNAGSLDRKASTESCTGFVSSKTLLSSQTDFNNLERSTKSKQNEVTHAITIKHKSTSSSVDRLISSKSSRSSRLRLNFAKVKDKTVNNNNRLTNYFTVTKTKTSSIDKVLDSLIILDTKLSVGKPSASQTNSFVTHQFNNTTNIKGRRKNTDRKQKMSTKRPSHDEICSVPIKKQATCVSTSHLPAKEETATQKCSISGEDEDDDCFVVTEGDKYGLLGTGEVCETERKNYFENLPVEVLENIFCLMPIYDILQVISCVCKRWNEIVLSPKFMPWKKSYNKLKLCHKPQDFMEHEEMDIARPIHTSGKFSFLSGLIKCIKLYSITSLHGPSVISCLQSHPKYPSAVALTNEKIPDVITDVTIDACSLIATLVILAGSVEDNSQLIHLLTLPSSHCATSAVLDLLYCIAKFLLMYSQKSTGVWNRMHYRLYYALYLYENQSTITRAQLSSVYDSSNTGQQTITKYSNADNRLEMTHEQLRICKHDVKPGEIIKIVAFAGTGKTTTLLRYTQLRPNTNFLLVVFNKSVCEHAKKVFPINVECRTSHSLAYQAIGHRYRNKLSTSSINVYNLTQTLELRKGDNLYVRAKQVQTTLNAYLASSDQTIWSEHVPSFYVDDQGRRHTIDPDKQAMYVQDAKYIWNKMCDTRDNTVKMSHDGYLKLYQLSSPNLHGYDVILIDEAQDLTPAVSDFLMRQSQGKVLVGDPNQQIYSFRGAANIMSIVSSTHTFYLTQSFRFGPEIARVASCCLEQLKKETSNTLVGNAKSGSILGDQIGQLAIITRCNYTLFAEAVKKCCYSEKFYRVSFIGGLQAFGFDMIDDIYTLMLPEQERGTRRVTHKFLRCFENMGKIEEYATKTMDMELLGKIRIVRTYMHTLPSCLKKIKEHHTSDMTQADILLTTAHKSKGLEFDTVCVADDFSVSKLDVMAQARPNVVITLVPPDEDNLLYVAITRAKKALIMSSTIYHLLQLSGDTFEEPVLSESLLQRQIPLVSMLTQKQFVPTSLTLQRPLITLSGGAIKGSGLLSPQDAWNSDWAQLLGLAPDEPDVDDQVSVSDSSDDESENDEEDFFNMVLAILL